MTEQELRIALLIAEGVTNREAAASLYLSPKTIGYHLGKVYEARRPLAHGAGARTGRGPAAWSREERWNAGQHSILIRRTCLCYRMCMSMTRRLQILLDEERHERLLRASRERRQSVGAVVRDAIDRALPGDEDRRRRAGRAILAAEPMDVPDDPAELRRELDEARSRGR